MTGLCVLDSDFNKCQYYIQDKKGCMAENPSCGFFETPVIKASIVNRKEPRWFEKYYNK